MKVTRREFFCALAAMAAPNATAASAAARLRLAICNETFAPLSLAEACRVAKQAGFAGLEIAPFTLGDDPAAVARAGRAELRDVMKSSGMEYVGLHALLTAPKGLHVTAPDETVRRMSWDYVRRLVDLAADLGSPCVMVFGSGKQRSADAGVTIADAVKRFGFTRSPFEIRQLMRLRAGCYKAQSSQTIQHLLRLHDSSAWQRRNHYRYYRRSPNRHA